MSVGYVVVWAEGVTDPPRATYGEALAAVRSVLGDPVIGHPGDIQDGGERTLFWASAELAENDAGVRVAGSVELRSNGYAGAKAAKLCRNHPEWDAPIGRGDWIALHEEAIEHGDDEQVRLCGFALAGNRVAQAECERVIMDARAQCDCDQEEGGRDGGR